MAFSKPEDASASIGPSGHAVPGLQRASFAGHDAAGDYAGDIDPAAAHNLVEAGEAVLVDVRTFEELKHVGSVPGAVHVAWQLGAAMTKNPRFLRELALKANPDQAVLFICRSGRRSVDSALAAAKAGYAHAFNVLEGVEGVDDSGTSGWRDRGLPWTPGR